MSFNDVHNVGNEYFHKLVNYERSFTHTVSLDEANFWLYFNENDHVDVFQEL